MVQYKIIGFKKYTTFEFNDYCKKKCIVENNNNNNNNNNNDNDNCIKNCESLLVDFFKTIKYI